MELRGFSVDVSSVRLTINGAEVPGIIALEAGDRVAARSSARIGAGAHIQCTMRMDEADWRTIRGLVPQPSHVYSGNSRDRRRQRRADRVMVRRAADRGQPVVFRRYRSGAVRPLVSR